MKCTKFIEQHLDTYEQDGDILKLLKNMLSDARRYQTDTLHWTLVTELTRIFHAKEAEANGTSPEAWAANCPPHSAR